MNISVPRPYSGPVPRPSLPINKSPSGRTIDPRAFTIAQMPGGRDYLAGLGPAPAGVNVPDPIPRIMFGSGFQSAGPATTLQQYLDRLRNNPSPIAQMALNRFQQSPATIAPPAGAAASTPTGTPIISPQGPVQFGGGQIPYNLFGGNRRITPLAPPPLPQTTGTNRSTAKAV